ncbi:hypothetical protein B0O99DRAFT_611724 [Bisporella sp. PMI_857]|nr:hypothetical protein B0O99DRAFT_611724 [Bisporella sp. PMI_857]
MAAPKALADSYLQATSSEDTLSSTRHPNTARASFRGREDKCLSNKAKCFSWLSTSSKSFALPCEGGVGSTANRTFSSREMPHADRKRRSNDWRGRHSNDWLFGGFNASNTVKRVIKKIIGSGR